MESAVPAQNTCNLISNQNIDTNNNFDNEFNDDTGFDDLLGLDDWEQMLDEDCISRLTTDFSTNFTNPNQKNISPSTTITTLTNSVKLPITTITKNASAAQTSRLVPHISTLSNQQSNKSNQPLVLVLSSSGSSPSQSTTQNLLTTQKLKTTSSPSLTPIASTSPMSKLFPF